MEWKYDLGTHSAYLGEASVLQVLCWLCKKAGDFLLLTPL